MRYKDYLKSDFSCPFCGATDRILKDNPTAYLTYALAPYHKHHLLIVPKEHVTSLFGLTAEQKTDINDLLNAGMEVLKKLNYSNFTVIVREGDSVAKSIQHLHYHIIPNSQIGDLDHDGNERRMLDGDEVSAITKDIVDALGDLS